jgi:signal peptidase I
MLGKLLRVYGSSMAPTLNPGEVVVVQERAYASRKPRKGEIVVARPAAGGGRAYIKRIAGVPNERVTIDGREWQLADGQFFLLGDYKDRSFDSRAFGPVSLDELVGPIPLRLWPPKRLEPA